MKLNIKDRLTILQILPTQGSLSEMVDIMDLAKELKLNDTEKTSIQYSVDEHGNVRWNPALDPNKEIALNSGQVEILKNVIKELDSQKKINAYTLDLALKIQAL